VLEVEAGSVEGGRVGGKICGRGVVVERASRAKG